MTNLTIRIKDDLKKNALKQAERLGIPVTLVVKVALQDFVRNPRVIIGEPEVLEAPPEIQEKMNKIAKLLRERE